MSKRSKKQEEIVRFDQTGLCDDMSFMVAEAYKMLRTKLNLMMTREDRERSCRVYGITSSVPSEGKTHTAINLAYAFAETGRNVCLIEADMRLPNIGRRLGIQSSPGLSNLLTKQATSNAVLQRYESPRGVKFAVITGGDEPPMPSELLESKKMATLLEALERVFDVIIVDLPPVGVVTDAISISPLLDGMMLVIRKGHCDKASLRDTMNQLRMAGAHIAGVVFNGAEGPGGNGGTYKNKGYYGHKYDKNAK